MMILRRNVRARSFNAAFYQPRDAFKAVQGREGPNRIAPEMSVFK